MNAFIAWKLFETSEHSLQSKRIAGSIFRISTATNELTFQEKGEIFWLRLARTDTRR